MKHHRHFLEKANFKHPFEGFSQAVVHRVVSGGLYFFLQRIATDTVNDSNMNLSEQGNAAIVGLSAGVLNGMLLHPIAIVKYHVWNSPGANVSFPRACVSLYSAKGISSFLRGINATGPALASASSSCSQLLCHWCLSTYLSSYSNLVSRRLTVLRVA